MGLVRPAGFEPAASCSGGKHSIQLSYGRIFYAHCRLLTFERQLMLSFGPLSNQPEQVVGGTGFLRDSPASPAELACASDATPVERRLASMGKGSGFNPAHKPGQGRGARGCVAASVRNSSNECVLASRYFLVGSPVESDGYEHLDR